MTGTVPATPVSSPPAESPPPSRRTSTYRPFAVRLSARTRLSPSFVRLTFTGPGLAAFGTTCLDQRIKLVLTDPDQTVTALDRGDDWYGWWLSQPDETRPVMRTYTARAVRPELEEVDVDFAVHGTEGPASVFAQQAELGTEVLLVGPDADVAGSELAGVAWKPGEASELVLVGDETAAPAICGIVETLPADVTGRVLIEVPAIEDALQLDAPTGVAVTWLARGGRPHGDALVAAVAEWAEGAVAGPTQVVGESETAPEELLWEEADAADRRYVWVAAEAATVARVRRHLVGERGLDRHACSFMGYWRLGRAG